MMRAFQLFSHPTETKEIPFIRNSSVPFFSFCHFSKNPTLFGVEVVETNGRFDENNELFKKTCEQLIQKNCDKRPFKLDDLLAMIQCCYENDGSLSYMFLNGDYKLSKEQEKLWRKRFHIKNEIEEEGYSKDRMEKLLHVLREIESAEGTFLSQIHLYYNPGSFRVHRNGIVECSVYDLVNLDDLFYDMNQKKIEI